MRTALLSLILALSLALIAGCGPGSEKDGPDSSGAPAVGAQPEKSPEEQAFENVVNNFESGNFAGATRAAADFVASYPESPRLPQVLYLSGRASLSREDFDDAAATLQEMISRFPQDQNASFADFYRAQAIYLKTLKPVKAYEIELNAALPGYEQALAAFEEVAEKYKGDAEVAARARLMSAQVLYDMGRREEALERFQGYLEENPEGEYADQALFQVGSLLMDLERYEEANDVFDQLTRAYPGNPRSGAAIDRIREMSLIGHAMPPLQNAQWVTAEKAPQTEGKVVLVVFFNTTCPHCQHEMPRLEAIYQKLKEKGLVVLALTSNSRDQNENMVRAFVSKYDLSFPVGLEPGSTADAYAVGRIPAAALVDKKGIVRWRNSGDLVTESLVERYL